MDPTRIMDKKNRMQRIKYPIMTGRFLVFVCMLSALVSAAQQKDYPIRAVDFTEVKLTDNFWLPRIKVNHGVTIPASFERCESTGRVRNFEMAAARSGKFCTIYPFDDTDIYKTIEGASFSLSLNPDPALEAYIDTLISKIGLAQEPDGYLYTARTINPMAAHAWAGKDRWEKEREHSHELYNAGHLYEAAAAHYQATGKRTLLEIALKNADLVCSVFGHNKKHVAPGHQVIEMGLVKLYRITGKKEYLETAKYFIEERGHYDGYDSASKDPFKNGAYWQDHIPVVDQQEAVGHAVRAGYLYAAVADVAAMTGDQKFLNAIDKIWNNVVEKKIYVQGGIGAEGNGERFAGNYELPNVGAYNETSSAMANVYWNHRMFLLHGDSKYIDVLEKTLYNAFLSGVGMDGKSFFYTNAMEIKNSFTHNDRETSRSGWFPCSCCPTNVTRLIPSIPGYMYAVKDKALYVNLFASSTTQVAMNAGDVEVIQENTYPWDGHLTFRINPVKAAAFDLLLRIPGWAREEAIPSELYRYATVSESKPEISVNGKSISFDMKNGYAVVSRKWKSGDVVEMNLPMPVRRVMSSPELKDNFNKISLERGPIMYCAEWPDNNGKTSNLILPRTSGITATFNPNLLNGVTVLNSEAIAITVNEKGDEVSSRRQPFVAIPYYAWAHRGKGEMVIWIPESIKGVDLFTREH